MKSIKTFSIRLLDWRRQIQIGLLRVPVVEQFEARLMLRERREQGGAQQVAKRAFTKRDLGSKYAGVVQHAGAEKTVARQNAVQEWCRENLAAQRFVLLYHRSRQRRTAGLWSG